MFYCLEQSTGTHRDAQAPPLIMRALHYKRSRDTDTNRTRAGKTVHPWLRGVGYTANTVDLISELLWRRMSQGVKRNCVLHLCEGCYNKCTFKAVYLLILKASLRYARRSSPPSIKAWNVGEVQVASVNKSRSGKTEAGGFRIARLEGCTPAVPRLVFSGRSKWIAETWRKSSAVRATDQKMCQS